MSDEQVTGPISAGGMGRIVGRNPIALKELRGRMRGARAFIVLTIYAGLMSLFTIILYALYSSSVSSGASATGGVIGKLIFGGVVAVELFLVCFVAPAFTAGAISGERERQTYDLLRTTLLPARKLVWGKLLSALAYVVLLLVVAIPLQSLAFLMGGVTFEEVAISLWLLFVTAVGFGTVGIFFSTYTRKTLNASILTYTFALVATVALPLLTLGLAGILAPLQFSASNNAALAEGLIYYVMMAMTSLSPLGAAVMSEITLLGQGTVFFYTQTLSNGTSIPLVSPWITYSIFVALVSFALLRWTVSLVLKVDE